MINFDRLLLRIRKELKEEGFEITTGLRYCVFIHGYGESISSFSNKKIAIKIAKRYLDTIVFDCLKSKQIYVQEAVY